MAATVKRMRCDTIALLGHRVRVACAAGTFAWCAPEMLLGRECNEKSDLYSFGVVRALRQIHSSL